MANESKLRPGDLVEVDLSNHTGYCKITGFRGLILDTAQNDCFVVYGLSEEVKRVYPVSRHGWQGSLISGCFLIKVGVGNTVTGRDDDQKG